MKIAAIIQARMGSMRLPGKVLIKVLGKTILEYAVSRVSKANVDKVIVATTTGAKDNKIVSLCQSLKIDTYRGSENDVLDRYYNAAKAFGAEHVIRITADCPLIDPLIINDGIKHYFDIKPDYCSNTLDRTYPDGEDVEIFSFRTLERAWAESKLQYEREHVTPYIKKHPEIFKLCNFKNSINIGQMRWTLDTREDLELIRAVIEGVCPKKKDFHMSDVLSFLKENPQLEAINKINKNGA